MITEKVLMCSTGSPLLLGSEREFEPAEPTEEDSGDRTEMTLVESLSPTIIIIPLVLVLIIICMVVAGVMISRRLRSKASGSGKRLIGDRVYSVRSRPRLASVVELKYQQPFTRIKDCAVKQGL